jgi:threonine/homoserine/homoserine lactone efflux protein
VDALALGLSMGLAAGVSPGPLLVLVVALTLRSGWRAGAAAACAPLLTDALVIAAALLVLDRLPARALAVLGVVGAALVAAVAVSTLRDARSARLLTTGGRPSGDVGLALRRAAWVNLLSPHPWIAWATVLGPLTLATWRAQPTGAVALVGGFYATLVGAKVGVAVLVAGGRRRLTDRGYRQALTAAGALLLLVAVALLVEFAPALV